MTVAQKATPSRRRSGCTFISRLLYAAWVAGSCRTKRVCVVGRKIQALVRGPRFASFVSRRFPALSKTETL